MRTVNEAENRIAVFRVIDCAYDSRQAGINMIEVSGIKLVDPQHLIQMNWVHENCLAAVQADFQGEFDIPRHQTLICHPPRAVDLKTFEAPAAFGATRVCDRNGKCWGYVRVHYGS